MSERRGPWPAWFRPGLAAILALALGFPFVPAAAAASWQVTTTADELNSDGDCSLREAIRAADSDAPVDACPAGSGADTISLPAGTYTLSLGIGGEDAGAEGDLDLAGSVKIVGAGPGATIIDANQIDRAIDVLAGADVTLSGLTIRNGSASAGGGLRNAGTLALSNVTVRDNTAFQGCVSNACIEPQGGFGGGVYNSGTLALTAKSLVTYNQIVGCCYTAMSGPNQGGGIYNAGSLRLNESTISYNTILNETGPTDTSGGGLYNTGSADITKSTVSNNTVNQCCGGGIANLGTLKLTNATISTNQVTHGLAGGVYNSGTATLTGVTVAFNVADPNSTCSPRCAGGGLYGAGSTYLSNSLLAHNAGGTDDCAGTLTSQGYNLIEHPNGCTLTGDPTGNIFSLNPKLGPLENNGPTWTHYPRLGSPAIDAGNPAAPGSGGRACPKLDQRGLTRPLDGDDNGSARCDIGAVEHL